VFAATRRPAADGSVELGLWHSADGGQRWARHGSPVSEGYVTSLAPSGAFAQDRTVFVATSAGVFRSREAGPPYELWDDQPGAPRLVALCSLDRLVYGLGTGGTLWRRPVGR
jgi:photosystem II stability/assembly factor-like uncharacterized protein